MTDYSLCFWILLRGIIYLETKVEPTHAKIKPLKITEKCTHARQSREQGLQPLLTDVLWGGSKGPLVDYHCHFSCAFALLLLF